MTLLKMTLLTASALICAQSAQAMDTKGSLLQKLVEANTKTFGAKNLFEEQIDFSTWNQVMKLKHM